MAPRPIDQPCSLVTHGICHAACAHSSLVRQSALLEDVRHRAKKETQSRSPERGEREREKENKERSANRKCDVRGGTTTTAIP